MTSHAVQIILEILIARHWDVPRQNDGKTPLTVYSAKAVEEQLFFNFSSDHAKVWFLDIIILEILFGCYWPYSIETAVNPPFFFLWF